MKLIFQISRARDRRSSRLAQRVAPLPGTDGLGWVGSRIPASSIRLSRGSAFSFPPYQEQAGSCSICGACHAGYAFSNMGRGIHATGYLMATTGRWQWLIMHQSSKSRGDYSHSVHSSSRDGHLSTLAGRLSLFTEMMVFDPSIRPRSQSWSW